MQDNLTHTRQDPHHDDDSPEAAGDQARAGQALRDAALLPGPERQVYLQDHPLHGDIVEIKTPPIREALLSIQEALKFRRPGLAFAADFRHGKTTMLAMVSQKMGEMFPHIPYRVITAAKHDKATEKATWTDVLDGLEVQCGGTAVDRKKAANSAILSACREANGDRFALYIDEGQNWGELEFNFLRDFTNELRQYSKKAVITITVGDLKIKTVAETLRKSDRGLWSRFLRKVHIFAGIQSQKELRDFLREYDSIVGCEYPLGSGISYSEFFLPHAYAAGWRLAHEAPRLWNELGSVATANDKKLLDVGMQWIADSILTFLTVQMHHDQPGNRPDRNFWKDAVASSQFETTFL